MMRFQPLITTGTAALLVIPAVTGGQDDIVSLTSALEGTEQALQVLRGIEEELAPGAGGSADVVPSDVVIRLTEAPIASGPVRDKKLELLRQEVNLLQAELDVLEARELGLAGAARPLPAFSLPESNNATGTSTTTGLTPDQLAALRSGPTPSLKAGPLATSMPGTSKAAATPNTGQGAGRHPGTALTPATTLSTPAHPSGAGSSYSADPLRHAQTCYRAGRFKEGFELIATLESPEAVYLQARFLEKLGRLEEAIAVLKGVIDRLPEGYESRRAESDLSFFEWKRDFLKRLPEGIDPKSMGGDTR